MHIPDGLWPILLTPYTENNEIDFAALDSLLEFYHKEGVAGLLALGQASEVLLLSDDERFAIAEHVARGCKGKLTLATVGNYGTTLAEQAASLKKIAAYGGEVAVVGLSLLPSSENLADQLLDLASRLGGIPLGIYELPEPEHRLLSADDVRRIAESNRFVFMKDTCRQIVPFSAKVEAARGSNLKLFQANLKVLPESMAAGSKGFCGWMPMVSPELCGQLVFSQNTPEELRQMAYEKLLDFQTLMVAEGFPSSAKYILAKRGVMIKPYSRVAAAKDFSEMSPSRIDAFIAKQRPFEAIH
ncbi:MAG: dihydrodipicolinate synthase family protein [Trueperaceae bacterium]|nr:dihydrodipicolinate synthase family protein [Trueperaceae bacterium]